MKFIGIENLDPHKLYKVCQITISKKPELYFVEDGYGYYHKDILKKILTLKGLSDDVEKVHSDEGLVYQGEGFTVNGMGGARLLSEKYILLFGNSVGFDISISNVHVEKYTKDNPEWRFRVADTLYREPYA